MNVPDLLQFRNFVIHFFSDFLNLFMCFFGVNFPAAVLTNAGIYLIIKLSPVLKYTDTVGVTKCMKLANSL